MTLSIFTCYLLSLFLFFLLSFPPGSFLSCLSCRSSSGFRFNAFHTVFTAAAIYTEARSFLMSPSLPQSLHSIIAKFTCPSLALCLGTGSFQPLSQSVLYSTLGHGPGSKISVFLTTKTRNRAYF